MEYRTTTGEVEHKLLGRFYDASDPIPPEGDGWQLVCAACGGENIYWFWQRVPPPEHDPEHDPERAR